MLDLDFALSWANRSNIAFGCVVLGVALTINSDDFLNKSRINMSKINVLGGTTGSIRWKFRDFLKRVLLLF